MENDSEDKIQKHYEEIKYIIKGDEEIVNRIFFAFLNSSFRKRFTLLQKQPNETSQDEK